MLSVNEVLHHYKIDVASEFGDEKRCLCPFHNDHNPSFDINSEGMWICRAGCGGGNLIQLVMKKDKVDYKTAELLLNNNFSLIISDDSSALTRSLDEFEKMCEAYVDETKTPKYLTEYVNAFVAYLIEDISTLPTTYRDLLSEWIMVIIYVKNHSKEYTTRDYDDLFDEFKNDIRGINNVVAN